MLCSYLHTLFKILNVFITVKFTFFWDEMETFAIYGSWQIQYSIENLFAVRKTGFKEHPGVIQELDLVEAEDQITHQLDIE